MKTLLILCFALVTTSTQEFWGLHDDETTDFEDIFTDPRSYDEEYMINSGEEIIPGEEDEEEIDDGDDPVSEYPEELNLEDLGLIHRPINQGLCGSCAWIAGTQTIEGRIAYVSENYIPYSLQNFMNCAGRPCVGASIYAVAGQVRKQMFIVPEKEIPYTKRKCVKEGERKTVCYANCGKNHPDKFTNALDDQFAIVAGIRSARSLPKLIAAIQRGPLTTCFSRRNKPKGEKCRAGCLHANSIIGYNKTQLLMRENYPMWGRWKAPKESICGTSLVKRAFYPNILYDYDRANAYFTELQAGVNETELNFLDKVKNQITADNTKNWGTAKNKCAFLGSLCKGVVAHSSGTFELVSGFGEDSSGPQRAFRKYQMVFYLRDEKTGLYVGTQKKRMKKAPKNLILAQQKSKAAAFFTSYGRLISFRYPKYHLVGKNFKRIGGTVRDIALDYRKNWDKKWSLENCIIYNEASNKVLDLIESEKQSITLGKGIMNRTSTSQRFSVGISGDWKLSSDELGMNLTTIGKKDRRKIVFIQSVGGMDFRWQARHIMNSNGKSVELDLGNEQNVNYTSFDVQKTQNVMTPIDCALGMPLPTTDGERRYFNIQDNELVMSEEKGGWTFEYADL